MARTEPNHDQINEETLIVDKLTLHRYHPDQSAHYGYTLGILDSYKLYSTNTQILANLLLEIALVYTGDLLTSEVHREYEDSIMIRTVTYTHTYSGDDLIGTEIS